MINFFYMILALMLGVIFFIPALIYGLLHTFFTGEKFSRWCFAIAIGIDELFGSIIYCQPDWTVSSYTYYLAEIKHRKWARRFMKVIDFLFGKKHCEKSYYWETTTERKL